MKKWWPCKLSLRNFWYLYIVWLFIPLQGFDVPLWKKILGKKLTGMVLFLYLWLLWIPLFSISILTFIRLLHLSAFLFSFPGGKPDDITVIVGQVVSSSNNWAPYCAFYRKTLWSKFYDSLVDLLECCKMPQIFCRQYNSVISFSEKKKISCWKGLVNFIISCNTRLHIYRDNFLIWPSLGPLYSADDKYNSLYLEFC